MPAMAGDALHAALARGVQRMLAEGGWASVTAASRAVGVDRRTLYRWMKGDVGLEELDRLCRIAGGTITLELGATREAASPSDWGRRLREDVAQVTDLLE